MPFCALIGRNPLTGGLIGAGETLGGILGGQRRTAGFVL